VSRKDGSNLSRTGKSLVNRHARTARIRENYLYTLTFQCGDEDLGAIHRFAPFRARMRDSTRFASSGGFHRQSRPLYGTHGGGATGRKWDGRIGRMRRMGRIGHGTYCQRSLEVGKHADLVLFDDQFRVICTIAGGELVYRNR
jgi:hypothetical protein